MTKPAFNYTLDWIALILFSSVLTTGLLLHLSLPPGSGGSSVLGLTRHEWGDVHFWIAMTMVVVILVHLIVHAKWIKALTLGKNEKNRWIRGAGAIVAVLIILGFIISILAIPVEPGERGHQRHAQVRLHEK